MSVKCPKCQFENPDDTRFCGKCGIQFPSPEEVSIPPTKTLQTPTKDLLKGSTFAGRYKLIEELGRGGMGVVYKAEQIKPVKRSVALKIIKLGMDTNQVVARFDTERQALAVMDHPNIAKVFDGGATETGRPYFVMELVRGIPITEYCDKHKLTTRERLELFIQVCQAVQHAHQKGVIHRDLKPSNILVVVQEDKPIPKIIDFGIAKATEHHLTERTLFTEQGQLIGTPEYMSPEQAEMSGLDVDTRTDIYSLGVILYELLIGMLPFDPETLRKAGFGEIQRIIRETDPPKASTRLSGLGDTQTSIAEHRKTDPSSLVRELKDDLDWITMKAMEKDRTRRYSTTSDLAADLARYLKAEPIIARPPSKIYNIGKFVRRHKIGVMAAALLIMSVVIGGIATTIGFVRATRAERLTKQEAETAKQVSDFLVDLFEVSDPSEARGNSVTAREILDKGAGKIEDELQEQPRVQSRLMETMGKVYRNLGLYTLAAPILEKSLSLKRKVYGEEHLEVAASLHTLAVLYDTQGKYQEAESFFRQSLAIKEMIFGQDHPEVARSLNSIAVVNWNQGKYDNAEPLFQKSLAIKEKALGPDDPEVGNTLTNLGALFHLQNKFEEAEPLFKRALAISEKVLGQDHPDVAASLNNLGSLYEDMGKREEAESLYERALAIWEMTLGPEHSDVGIALHNLANLFRNQGKYDKAEPYYVRSEAIFIKALGEEHPYVAYSFREHANLYRDRGQYEEAEDLYVRALELFEKSSGPDHLNMAETLENYALLLRKIDRTNEAEKLEARVKTIWDKN
jgi:serine/threonine protein kinase/Tfp pilus assembly protein PilF